MRYVGEKNFDNPKGDQVPNRGNGALIESQDSNWPIYLFEKVSENPVKHRYIGQVEVVDFEHNYRPTKSKREFDFYLRRIDLGESSIEPSLEEEPTDDLAPGTLRDIRPRSRNVPESEETISYESSKKKQAKATNTHEQTVEILRDRLIAENWDCHETDETDILAMRDNQVLLVEVKSVNGSNDSHQLRKALGQLHENCYREVVRRGWNDRTLLASLAFSQPPADQYSGYIEYLRRHGIETLWIENEEISGLPESVDRITGESQ